MTDELKPSHWVHNVKVALDEDEHGGITWGDVVAQTFTIPMPGRPLRDEALAEANQVLGLQGLAIVRADRIDELEKQLGILHESDGREAHLGITAEGVAQIRVFAEAGPNDPHGDALRMAVRYYDLVRKAWEGCREDFDEVVDERDKLKAELRKSVPSEGVMHQRLALYAALAEVAGLVEIFGQLLRDRVLPGSNGPIMKSIDAWLKLPAVTQARKAVKG